MLVSSLKHTGYVATPDCFRTFGLLGAVSSFSIVHLALPLPVFVAVQPAGAWPVGALSKETASFGAAAKRATDETMRTASFILPPILRLELNEFVRYSNRSASIGSSRGA